MSRLKSLHLEDPSKELSSSADPEAIRLLEPSGRESKDAAHSLIYSDQALEASRLRLQRVRKLFQKSILTVFFACLLTRGTLVFAITVLQFVIISLTLLLTLLPNSVIVRGPVEGAPHGGMGTILEINYCIANQPACTRL
jgi:hypothetical protein